MSCAGTKEAVRNIHYIKLGDSKVRKNICTSYLEGHDKSRPGIFLGFYEASEEHIRAAIAKEKQGGDCEGGNPVEMYWDDVCNDLGSGSAATRGAAVIRIVCMASQDDIFFTFHKNKLWWCRPAGSPGENIDFESGRKGAEYPENAKRRSDLVRRISADGWRSTSLDGIGLDEWKISGRLIRKQMVQSTLASLKEKEDRELFLWTVGLAPDTEYQDFMKVHSELEKCMRTAIKRLSPTDFETLVDMILVNNGWIRAGGIGGNTKDIDGEYVKPITGEHVVVQDKSSLSMSILVEAIPKLFYYSRGDERNGSGNGEDDRPIPYLVYHTYTKSKKGKREEFSIDDVRRHSKSALAKADVTDDVADAWIARLRILDVGQLAHLAMDQTIIDWLMKNAFGHIAQEQESDL